MKKLFIILSLLILAINVNGQFIIPKRKEIPEPVKIIAIFASSIVLESIGDALCDDGKKISGHTFGAMSTGILFVSPFILNIDKNSWHWYLGSYVSFRIALFDPVYNIIRGLPMFEIGNTSLWDKGLQQFNPSPGIQVFGRSLCFMVGISIPIKKLKL